MPRFLTGDELGNIKAIQHPPNAAVSESKGSECATLYDGTTQESPTAIQVLALARGSELLATGSADGSAAAFSFTNDNGIEKIQTWRETRFKDGQRYVGMKVSARGVFSCTSSGALRLTPLQNEGEPSQQLLSVLPSRLYDWRMSPNEDTFAYGGEEVDLSVWNTEVAFAHPPKGAEKANPSSKKRKRQVSLFPGEIWRAKNIQNDALGLRQPIRITSLTYLPHSPHTHQLLTGTQLGDVRRYDTRAARRPVSDWKISKVGGIKTMEMGFSEQEVFVGDDGYNLSAIDLRNGRVLYGYKGLSGAVTSIAPSPSILASTALDRYTRIHSTFPPPLTARGQQTHKGEVLDKVFMKSIPTVIVWDGNVTPERMDSAIEGDDDDMWRRMEHVEDEDDTVLRTRHRHSS